MDRTTSNWLNKYNILFFDQIDSTNEEAKRIALSPRIEGNFIVVARSQTKGRGRYGRTWISPEGNLYFSILLKDLPNIELTSQLTFIASISLGESIEEIAQKRNKTINLRYKWPNDIFISGSKVSGILLESKFSSKVEWVIIGIGVNTDFSPLDMPYPVANLKSEIGEVSNEEILNLFMNNFEKYRNIWSLGNFNLILNKWKEKLYFEHGDVITITSNRQRISGIFESIKSDGSIIIKLSNDELYEISSGEIILT